MTVFKSHSVLQRHFPSQPNPNACAAAWSLNASREASKARARQTSTKCVHVVVLQQRNSLCGEKMYRGHHLTQKRKLFVKTLRPLHNN